MTSTKDSSSQTLRPGILRIKLPKFPKPSTTPNPATTISVSTSGREPTESPGQSCKRKARDEDDEDTVTILNAVIEFRSKNHGAVPTPTTMRPVFDAVTGSLHRDLTIEQLYNRFRSLRYRYSMGPGSTPCDREFFDLSEKAWGDYFNFRETAIEQSQQYKKPKIEEVNGDDNDNDNGDGGGEEEEENDDEDKDNDTVWNSFKHLTEQMTTYWKDQGLPMATLELGLKYMDKAKATVLEEKWRKYFTIELNIKSKSAELSGNVVSALVGRKRS